MHYSSNVFYRILLPVITGFVFTTWVFGQQIDLPRINSMPDFPQPYHMRAWKQVAWGYDSLVFDQNLQGQYQPFIFFREQPVNYPDDISFGLHTAVGTHYPASGEAINVIPAVVGATLAGIDKTDQFETNWVSMIKEYFNRRPAENIYLNHPVTSSGHDWWYETMPNIFFMQLKHLYPDIEIFHTQLPKLANQWKRAIRAMGAGDTPWQVPYMNYRAWNMSEMAPLDQGVKQPEAAGALAWIFYHSYIATGNTSYLKGAEWALEFLDSWQENPSYELQLPYGIYTAARMNAEVGTSYDVEKMLNWAFDRGDLRGWGAISGNWGGYDCHGLIGEANDNGNDYAFMMNGFQQAAALVPMLRYDHRFARAIAKWVLNMANASRLFYPNYMPDHMQDNVQWAQTYDPHSFIAYEALREIKHGYSPFATGDAVEGNWAQTNLMLYASSHVGYLAAITDTTNVEGILQLDLLATDFYRQEAFPSWLYYNPFETAQTVHLYLPAGNFLIYDVAEKEFLHQDISGMASLQIPPGQVLMPVVIPASAEIQIQGNKTLANGIVIDFHNGQPTGCLPPRIKALAAADTILVTGGSTQVYCTATDPQQSAIEYMWFVDGEAIEGEDQFTFTASQETGFHTLACRISNACDLQDSVSVVIEVVEKIPYAPKIQEVTALPRKLRPMEQAQLLCLATDHYNDPLSYHWHAEAGTIAGQGAEVLFTAPGQTGNFWIRCTATNPDEMAASDSVRVMVRHFEDEGQGNQIAFYPLRGNVRDHSGNQLHAQAGGGLLYTPDMNHKPGYAAWFNGTSAYALLPQSELLNFAQAMSITAFFKTDQITPHEQHPISHGSWEHRYKVSISYQRLRFTLNTSEGIKDLDSETLIQPGQWYHMAVTYNQQDMEIWINGKLDAFTCHSGIIQQSPVNPVLGQNLPGNNHYNFKGAMSLLNIYDFALSPAQIGHSLSMQIPEPESGAKLIIFPNPVTENLLHVKTETTHPLFYQIVDAFGRILQSGHVPRETSGSFSIVLNQAWPAGLYFLKISSTDHRFTGSFLLIR